MRPLAALLSLVFAAGVVAQERQLVYELPIDALQRAWRDQPDTTLERELARYVDVLRARAGDDVTVERDGATRLVVTLPAVARDDELSRLRRRLEVAGTLELRIVASAERGFDLAAERPRLQVWLDAGGRERVLADPRALDAFHADPEHGPIAPGTLRWHVRRIPVALDVAADNDTRRWEHPFAGVPAMRDACVPLYGDEQWNGGHVPADAAAPPFLVELVAVDLAQASFSHADLDLSRVRELQGARPGVRYVLRGERQGDYLNWSRDNIGRCCAVILDGVVESAPRFESAIPGVGLVVCADATAAEELANVLRAGQLPVPPVLVE